MAGESLPGVWGGAGEARVRTPQVVYRRVQGEEEPSYRVGFKKSVADVLGRQAKKVLQICYYGTSKKSETEDLLWKVREERGSCAWKSVRRVQEPRARSAASWPLVTTGWARHKALLTVYSPSAILDSLPAKTFVVVLPYQAHNSPTAEEHS